MIHGKTTHWDSDRYEARGHSPDVPLSVDQLNWYVKNIVQEAVPKVWVEGEVTDLSRPSSGHLYFSLKDENSQIRAVVWRSVASRLRFKLADGQALVVSGNVEVYPPRGTYQLVIDQLQPKGMGALQIAFQQLHQKLQAEGLFDSGRKKTLPRFPTRIGFVTSPSGAAIHDFIEAATSRWNHFRLIVIPARVQGESAAQEIAHGIQLAQRLRPRLDVLVVGRGGGSQEDLWCFNEEKVVRALAHCKLPTVSAVGHEIDVTLADMAADCRALTPTHAAQVIFPDRTELRRELLQTRARLDSLLRTRVTHLRRRIQDLAQLSILGRPHELHKQRRQKLDDLELRSRSLAWTQWKHRRERLAGLARAVEALSPLSVLHRGYSVTQNYESGETIRQASDFYTGQLIQTIVGGGQAISRIEQISLESETKK
ncbi:MAG: exodeoxyribonuclease VII large subunit [Planctomycetales bacterium]|nr:exodeoxyribonuclease VII large subunit [Planctomycetales bacterium]